MCKCIYCTCYPTEQLTYLISELHFSLDTCLQVKLNTVQNTTNKRKYVFLSSELAVINLDPLVGGVTEGETATVCLDIVNPNLLDTTVPPTVQISTTGEGGIMNIESYSKCHILMAFCIILQLPSCRKSTGVYHKIYIF